MKRIYFKTMFSMDNFPDYACPICEKAVLIKEEFVSGSTAASRKNASEEWWEPEYEDAIFRLTLKCPRCEELVYAHGDGFIEEEVDIDDDGELLKEWVWHWRPKNFFPALKFIDCPPATPKEVKSNLESASALYYSHPAAACNCLRMAAEEILISLGVSALDSGKFISFGNRIKKLPKSSNEYNLLDAIRWLGNDGSHSGSIIKHEDAANAFEVIDLLVEELYSDRKKKIHELAAAIRKNKGPVSQRGY